MNTPSFLVSIRCMTYNHAPYIEDAMNGFCMQQTDFPFVAIIVDDASTDGEPEVIRRYLNTHFEMEQAEMWETDDAHFIYAQHQENKNCHFAVILLKYNFWQAKKSKIPLMKQWTDTKYIALCEGDDYWTCALKLQQQIDYLENHNDCGFVYTQVIKYIQTEGTMQEGWCKKSTFEDMLISNKVCTATTCFRRNLYKRYIDEIKPGEKGWLMGDYPMWLYYFANSSPYFMDSIMGTYRVLPNSASHFQSYEKWEKFYCSSYHLRLFYAQKYGYTGLLSVLTNKMIGDVVWKSDVCDRNTSVFFLPFYLKYKIKGISYINAATTHNRLCRRLYSFLSYRWLILFKK